MVSQPNLFSAFSHSFTPHFFLLVYGHTRSQHKPATSNHAGKLGARISRDCFYPAHEFKSFPFYGSFTKPRFRSRSTSQSSRYVLAPIALQAVVSHVSLTKQDLPIGQSLAGLMLNDGVTSIPVCFSRVFMEYFCVTGTHITFDQQGTCRHLDGSPNRRFKTRRKTLQYMNQDFFTAGIRPQTSPSKKTRNKYVS